MKQGQETTTRQGRLKRHSLHLILWSMAMAAALMLTAYAIREKLLPTAWLAIASFVPAAFGICATLVYRQFLREADELQRKIELDALALAFAAGILGGITYSLLAHADVVATANVSYLVAFMFFAYPVGIFIGRWRYS